MPLHKVEMLPKKDSHFTAYSNALQVHITNWDFQFEFGEMQPVSSETVQIRPVATLIMSPQHAKAMAGILSKNVAQYEKDFGEIRFEPADQKQTGPEKK